MFTFRHSWPELYIFTQSIFRQRDSLFPQFCFHPVDPTNNIHVHTRRAALWGAYHYNSVGSFLKGLWATICKPHRISAIFRRVGKKVTLHSFLNLNCLFFLYGKISKIVQILPGYEVWHCFQAQTIVHCIVLGRLTKLTRRQRSHPIWPYSFQLERRQLQCYIIPCSKFQPRWWMECSGRVNTWECLQALLAQPWLYSKSRSIQLDYWHLTMYMYL